MYEGYLLSANVVGAGHRLCPEGSLAYRSGRMFVERTPVLPGAVIWGYLLSVMLLRWLDAFCARGVDEVEDTFCAQT